MYFPFVTAKSLTRFGEPHSALMRAFPRLQTMLVLACDCAVRGNRITVSREGHPVVHYRLTDEVAAFSDGRISISAAHLMGGSGMGRDASDSVTGSGGRVRGVPWLRVENASLFPDALEINPHITVMALAARTAQVVRADAGELLRAA